MARKRKRFVQGTDFHEYPRPQLARDDWTNLNGAWDFQIDAGANHARPDDVPWTSRKIRVPFAPETPLSGIDEHGFFKAVWYRRTFDAARAPGRRVILHFGAVDYHARVWVNNRLAIEHEGGYAPFHVDITDLLHADARGQSIVVRAFDDPADMHKPRGKQDWQPEPHSIWYPRTTGIWQTVWLELVPETRITWLQWSCNVADWSISMHAQIEGGFAGHRLSVRLRLRDRLLINDTCAITGAQIVRTFHLNDPGIDDVRNQLLWFPHAPNLIDVDLEIQDGDGKVIDRATSYTALRSVGIEGNRFILNGRPMELKLVLDQGYWREGGLTAPSDHALRRDVELVKALGFNGVRKHQKIEDPRFLYWADRLGLLVWEEMPSAYAFDSRTVNRIARQWTETIERDSSHPCIICWVPLNESWGVPDLPHRADQREFVRALYHLTKSLDPTRPVIGNDGWENIATDIIAIHDYDGDVDRIARRYENSPDRIEHLMAHECPGHKALLIDGFDHEGKPIMLTEFGGIAFSSDPPHTWGYRRARTSAQFKRQLADLMKTINALPLFAGFCYTQFTDTYQEANGLLTMDRKPKLPIAQIRAMISP